MSAATLDRHEFFNCCAGGVEPKWSEYSRLLLNPSRHDPDVYVVCGVTKGDDVDEITATGDRAHAGEIACALAERSGLPLERPGDCKTCLLDEIKQVREQVPNQPVD
jgi:hypothetical protein